ncbi:uncharacterized protein [Amphiura filiformis]|uniref:uncharacterized protein n=1 Tax=Amphiura filiformis TaxID=82378 RepID=UPI003B22463E
MRKFPRSLRKTQSFALKPKNNEDLRKVSTLDAASSSLIDFGNSRDVISPSEEDLLELLHKNYIYRRTSRDGTVNLVDLPDEILLRIVSFVNPLGETFVNLKHTCRRLRAITDDVSLYPHRHLRIPPYALFSFNTLQVILDVSRNTLSSLDVSDCEDVNDYNLFRLVSNIGNLVKLNISGCKQLTNAALRVIGNHTTALQWIDFSRCPLITCAGVQQLFQCLGRTLQHVNMSNCLGIRKDPHKLTAISRYFASLRHLSVGWSRDLVKLNPLLDMDLDRLTRGCTDLTYLDISYSHSTNTSMATITSNCPNLETLLAKQCFVQDNGLKSIGQGLPRLKRLDLTDCWYVTDKGLESIAFGCTQLEIVVLTRCYEIRGNGVVVLASHCKKMTSLILRQCFRVDDQALQYVGLSNPKLRYLDVSFNMNITMDTVRLIRRRRPLVRLVTEGCPGVSFFGSKSRFRFYQVDLNKNLSPTPSGVFKFRETAV